MLVIEWDFYMTQAAWGRTWPTSRRMQNRKAVRFVCCLLVGHLLPLPFATVPWLVACAVTTRKWCHQYPCSLVGRMGRGGWIDSSYFKDSSKREWGSQRAREGERERESEGEREREREKERKTRKGWIPMNCPKAPFTSSSTLSSLLHPSHHRLFLHSVVCLTLFSSPLFHHPLTITLLELLETTSPSQRTPPHTWTVEFGTL